MSNINGPAYEAIERLNNAIDKIQSEFQFLKIYLDDNDQQRYAKAFVDLEDISQTVECVLADRNKKEEK